ncbi:DinB family protein [Cohnella abietis]|uniref:DinB-like domain-containing protein n=1 Tax=Cohnella abietis TaxID=2507935 RepID=A0A3T1DE01_9BACL|nr:DinB family protein [Cohnella abietis]BBI36322.1 hypothetical protein KCTCHS21_57210 [Cohnella abietis]
MNNTNSSAASIQLYQNTFIKIREAVDTLTDEQLQWKPAPGKWSVTEVVTHLVDSNLVNSYRIRQLLSESRPELMPYAHDQWVFHQQTNSTPMEELLLIYEAITRYNALLLSRIDDNAWDKLGWEESHSYTLRHIIEVFVAGHVDIHMAQIERIKSAYREEGIS